MALGDGTDAVNGIVGWWKLDGDLKNSELRRSRDRWRGRGVDRKWKAAPCLAG